MRKIIDVHMKCICVKAVVSVSWRNSTTKKKLQKKLQKSRQMCLDGALLHLKSCKLMWNLVSCYKVYVWKQW